MCERMVRTTKDSLRRTLYKSDLNWEQLRTAIAKVEFAAYSRPITYIDIEELAPITPLVLVSGRRTSGPTEKSVSFLEPAYSTCDGIIPREKHRRLLIARWWGRFKLEYMRDLDQFRCPDRRGRKISRGDLVLIHDDNAKRLWWRHGIVDTLHMGPDGKSSTGPSSASIRWSFTFQMNPSQRETLPRRQNRLLQ